MPAADGQPHDDLSELRLDDRVVLVTGGARGIGRAVGRLLGRRGAKVALFDRNADALADTGMALAAEGVVLLGLVGDVTRSADATAAVEACVDTWGRLDVVVNNAGI